MLEQKRFNMIGKDGTKVNDSSILPALISLTE
jgi:hypothetical protein